MKTKEEIISEEMSRRGQEGQRVARERVGEEEYVKERIRRGRMGGRPKKVPVDK